MPDTRKVSFKDPKGRMHVRTRRCDQENPEFAIMCTEDGHTWEICCVTQNASRLIRSVKELLQEGKSAFITHPEVLEKKQMTLSILNQSADDDPELDI